MLIRLTYYARVNQYTRSLSVCLSLSLTCSQLVDYGIQSPSFFIPYDDFCSFIICYESKHRKKKLDAYKSGPLNLSISQVRTFGGFHAFSIHFPQYRKQCSYTSLHALHIFTLRLGFLGDAHRRTPHIHKHSHHYIKYTFLTHTAHLPRSLNLQPARVGISRLLLFF